MATPIQIPVSRLKYFKPIGTPTAPNDQVLAMAESILADGILKPLIVRPVGDLYEVVCGLVRWKGALVAGVETVPAEVRHLSDAEAQELAFSDNSHPFGDSELFGGLDSLMLGRAALLEDLADLQDLQRSERPSFVISEPLSVGFCKLFAKDFNAEMVAAEFEVTFPGADAKQVELDLAAFHRALEMGRLELHSEKGLDLGEFLLAYVDAYMDVDRPEIGFISHAGYWESFSSEEQELVRADVARLAPIVSALSSRR